MKLLKLSWILFFSSVFLFGVVIGSTLAISQDDFCNLINENMTISQCNDLWEIMNNNTIIYEVTNTTIEQIYNYTTIENYSVDLENYVLIDDLEDLFDEHLEEIEQDTELEKLKLEYEKEIRLAEIQAGITNESESEDEECDMFCEFEKQIEYQQKVEMTKLQYCAYMPNLDFCKTSTSTNNVSNGLKTEEVVSLINQKFSEQNQQQPEPEKNDNTLKWVLVVAIVGILFIMFKEPILSKLNQKPQIQQYDLQQTLTSFQNAKPTNNKNQGIENKDKPITL